MGSAAFSSLIGHLSPSQGVFARPSDSANGSPHTLFVAEIIESSVDLHESGVLNRGLSQGLSLKASLENLSLSQHSLLSQRFGARAVTEFGSLAEERDPELFLEGLIAFAQRNHRAGRSEAALALSAAAQRFIDGAEYSASLPASFRSRVGGQVAALQGQGTFGQTVEHHLQNFVREATHPAMLAGFGFGAAAFQSARLLALTRLSTSSAGVFTRGFGARCLAGTLGWAAEVPALTFGSRSVRGLMGESQSWNSRVLGHELGATAITLGLMRLSAFGARRAFETVHGISVSGAALSAPAFQQGAMLGSLMLAHDIEARLGLRPATDLAGNFTESLTMLLQFHVGGRLFHALQPQGFSRALEFAESQSRSLPRPNFIGTQPSLLPMGPWSRAPALAADSPEIVNVMMAELPKRGLDSRTEVPPTGSSRSTSVPLPFNFRDLTEEAPDPVIVTDIEGRAIYLNRAGRELIEESRFSWLNRTMEQNFRLVEGETEIFMFTKDGADASFWRIRSQDLEFAEGMRAHYLKDITAVRLLEEAKMMLEMEKVLAEGLIHDAGNMLADAILEEKLLEKTLAQNPRTLFPRGIPTRSPGISRDSETPLSARSLLSTVIGGVKNLGSTLSTTLQVFRDSQRTLAGANHVLILPMDVLLGKALRLNEKMRAQSDIRLVTDFGEEPPIMMGEEGPLLSAVLNLLINACHAMPRGGELRVRSFAAEGQVVIEVQDSGIGIAAENLAHIFEPHFTTKVHSGGTGMGLANVKIAVERIHRGRIEVDSAVGEGTTFRLILPQTRPRQRSH